MRRSLIAAGVAVATLATGVNGPAQASGAYRIKAATIGSMYSSIDLFLSQKCDIKAMPDGMNGLDAVALAAEPYANHSILVTWSTAATAPNGQGMGQVWAYDGGCHSINLPRLGTSSYTIPVPSSAHYLVFHGDQAATIDFDVRIAG